MGALCSSIAAQRSCGDMSWRKFGMRACRLVVVVCAQVVAESMGVQLVTQKSWPSRNKNVKKQMLSV